MDQLFASYLAEEPLPPVKMSGAYDPVQQVWVGDPFPLASGVTEDSGGATGLYWTGVGWWTLFPIWDTGYNDDYSD